MQLFSAGTNRNQHELSWVGGLALKPRSLLFLRTCLLLAMHIKGARKQKIVVKISCEEAAYCSQSWGTEERNERGEEGIREMEVLQFTWVSVGVLSTYQGWWQMDAGSPFTTRTWGIFGICFLLQFDLSSECINSPAVEPASTACMVHKVMDILCWIRHFIHCLIHKACKLSLQPSAIFCKG